MSENGDAFESLKPQQPENASVDPDLSILKPNDVAEFEAAGKSKAVKNTAADPVRLRKTSAREKTPADQGVTSDSAKSRTASILSQLRKPAVSGGVENPITQTQSEPAANSNKLIADHSAPSAIAPARRTDSILAQLRNAGAAKKESPVAAKRAKATARSSDDTGDEPTATTDRTDLGKPEIDASTKEKPMDSPAKGAARKGMHEAVEEPAQFKWWIVATALAAAVIAIDWLLESYWMIEHIDLSSDYREFLGWPAAILFLLCGALKFKSRIGGLVKKGWLPKWTSNLIEEGHAPMAALMAVLAVTHSQPHHCSDLGRTMLRILCLLLVSGVTLTFLRIIACYGVIKSNKIPGKPAASPSKSGSIVVEPAEPVEPAKPVASAKQVAASDLIRKSGGRFATAHRWLTIFLLILLLVHVAWMSSY